MFSVNSAVSPFTVSESVLPILGSGAKLGKLEHSEIFTQFIKYSGVYLIFRYDDDDDMKMAMVMTLMMTEAMTKMIRTCQ